MEMKNRIVGVVVTIFLMCGQAVAWQGKVVRVLDGDSILVKRAGRIYEIRLYGIDAPEYRQPFGKQAGRITRDMIKGKIVSIQRMDVDRYHRIVALVKSDGRLVNRELVRRGAAWLYPKYCQQQPLCRELRSDQQRADKQHLGLWAGKNPLSPAQWKRRNKRSSHRYHRHFRHHRQY